MVTSLAESFSSLICSSAVFILLSNLPIDNIFSIFYNILFMSQISKWQYIFHFSQYTFRVPNLQMVLQNFFFFNLLYLFTFLAALGLHCYSQAFSSCCAGASHCSGFSYSEKGFEWIEAGPLLWESDNWAVVWRTVTCRSFGGWERAFMLEVRQALKALFHLSRWWGCFRLTWTLATWYNLCFRNILALMWGRGDRKVMMA